jgi:hypothetical protein
MVFIRNGRFFLPLIGAAVVLLIGLSIDPDTIVDLPIAGVLLLSTVRLKPSSEFRRTNAPWRKKWVPVPARARPTEAAPGFQNSP